MPNNRAALRKWRFQWPLTLGMATASLQGLKFKLPELFQTLQLSGYLRGIDFYSEEALPTAYQQALNLFLISHKRMPDLNLFPQTVDYYFAQKFFCPIPVAPNPTDKLNAASYLTRKLREEIALPERPWISDSWHLPDHDAVEPGKYFFKYANGSSMHKPVHWPPSREKRRELETLAEAWGNSQYGLQWGEWWYSSSTPRFFLEEDLSDAKPQLFECGVFVRGGVPRLLQMRRDTQDGVALERLYTPDGTTLRGSTGGPRRKQFDQDARLPDCIDTILRGASEIARHFYFARVDFLYTEADKPYLGEITLCPYKARVHFLPRSFDLEAKHIIFGDRYLDGLAELGQTRANAG